MGPSALPARQMLHQQRRKGADVTETVTASREATTDATSEIVVDALVIIDKALAEMLRRELVSSGEVADLLLDLRSVLTAKPAVSATSSVG